MAAHLLAHREDIKAQIRIKYGTLGQFERDMGLPTGSASDVLRGKSVRRTAEAIASVLGTSISTLFPGRFGEQTHDTSINPDTHRLNERAS